MARNPRRAIVTSGLMVAPVLAVVPAHAVAPPEPMARIAGLPPVSTTAHRGAGSFLAPENTAAAFERGLQDPNADVLEFDVRVLADGVGGVWHDDTVDRISTSTGPVSSFTSAKFKALTIDAASWFGGNAVNTRPLLLNEVLDRFGGRKVLMAEPKDAKAAQLIIKAVQARGLTGQVILQSFSFADAKLAAGAGMVAQLLISNAEQAARYTPAVLKEAGIPRVSLYSGLPDSVIAPYVRAGLFVACWNVNRQYRRDQLLKLGVRGIDTDDPGYIRGDASSYHRTTDPFGSQTWWYGHMGQSQSPSALGSAERGRFTGPDWWSVPRSTTPLFVRQGWASPAPKTFALRTWIRFDALSTEKTRWAGLYFSALRDHAYNDSSGPDTAGYSVILRQNGQLQLYRKEPTRTVLLKTAATPALKNGTIAKISVRVSATSIYVRRYDVTTPAFTANDKKYRGPYLFLGRAAGANNQGPAVSFANVEYF